ncbi:MAG: hypothetical protein HLUCCA08_07045 [Rhodobacteraceae bacterium HLUCCA08]|nr:MAG: hypothetical protein HLUCCA08_07045 [Rhodobacteraceae bacterium HLUCCA08]
MLSGAKPLYWCAVKAIRLEVPQPPGLSRNWATARRGILRIRPDRATCGDWTIPFDQITGAVVWTGPSPLGRTRVLMLSTAEASWQFSLNPWANPLPHLPFAVEERPLDRRLSWISYAVWGLVAVILLAVLLDL